MKVIVAVGRPMHFRPRNRKITACGMVIQEEWMTYDPRDVECVRCSRTHAYRESIGTNYFLDVKFNKNAGKENFHIGLVENNDEWRDDEIPK